MLGERKGGPSLVFLEGEMHLPLVSPHSLTRSPVRGEVRVEGGPRHTAPGVGAFGDQECKALLEYLTAKC